jgi:hypothetical protein
MSIPDNSVPKENIRIRPSFTITNQQLVEIRNEVKEKMLAFLNDIATKKQIPGIAMLDVLCATTLMVTQSIVEEGGKDDKLYLAFTILNFHNQITTILENDMAK